MIKTTEQIFDEFLTTSFGCYCDWPVEEYLHEELKATMRGEILFCDIHEDTDEVQNTVLANAVRIAALDNNNEEIF